MLPKNVLEILSTLENSGYEAYIVGGAVRNYMLKHPIKDWDITTSATPDVIQSLFKSTYDVGKAFGTIVVVLNGESFEVTTYRKESTYSNGRHPDAVIYSKNLEDDLMRRDFTINAMVMTPSEEIKDFYKGKESIEKRMLYTVGHPEDRFTEDYLRVYRYVRLTQELNFNRNEIIDKTIKEMPMNKLISFERIQTELNRILLSDNPSKGILHLKELNLLSYIIEGIEKTYDFDQHSKYHHLDVFYHTMEVLDHTPKILEVRLAALLHDIGKPDTFSLVDNEGHFYGHHRRSMELSEHILTRLKYSNKIIETVLHLIHFHMIQLDHKENSIRKFIRKIKPEYYQLWSDLRKADILGCQNQETIEEMIKLDKRVHVILNEVPPLTVNDLNISGHDLMTLGYYGKKIGIIKKELLEWLDEHPDQNHKEALIEQALKINS
ncbi:MAG: CCA tRNA nucleotidyltransferase [Clostridia bacterium]|nr:CCA tRNA nucleotidyltransferase [Clostridia bacterium]